MRMMELIVKYDLNPVTVLVIAIFLLIFSIIALKRLENLEQSGSFKK